MKKQYKLKGSVFLDQYCHVNYPPKTGLKTLRKCQDRDSCPRHTLSVAHSEIVLAHSLDDVIDESLSQFERLGDAIPDLEPSWNGIPEITEMEQAATKTQEEQALDLLREIYITLDGIYSSEELGQKCKDFLPRIVHVLELDD